jgi:hypothetical protein
VKVLARLYFNITEESVDKVGWWKEREKHFLPSCRKWEQNLKWWSPSLSFIVESWGKIHVVKDNGSGWLRWLTGRGHPPKSHPKSETKGCFRTSLS